MASRFFMAFSIISRLFVGVIVFVLLARGLGPEIFGFISTVFAYATLASLLSDFGFQTKTLRDIAADPTRGGSILNESLNVKALLMIGSAAIGFTVIATLPMPLEARISAALLTSGVLIASFGDLALVCYRATGRFADEAVIVGWTSALYVLAVGGTALLNGGVLAVSITFLLCRAIYAAAALIGVARRFPNQPFGPTSTPNLLLTFRRSGSWAIDSGLNFLAGQIDGLVVAHVLGLGSAGVYQAGSRFVQAALSLVAILSNIHIPALASGGSADATRRRERRMAFEFALMGAVLALAIWLGGPVITRILLGPKYGTVDNLWPGFAVFIFARYLAAAFGAALAARNQPALRIGGQIAGLSVVAGGFMLLIPHHGLSAIPYIMAAGAATSALVYAIGRMALSPMSRK
ncbi:MAG: oligosaccharide flippase family protein [bacterium]|nr:oligosaccharide flippase family protein [bacterium]